ncbi:cell adhesion molecule Dscam2-like [Scylla paramamosain]|uniref:cell adhesion molecule Dscam2-like n=1 Tax=Scylla paramamosain TaxID=85552 RepID=UPI0030835090
MGKRGGLSCFSKMAALVVMVMLCGGVGGARGYLTHSTPSFHTLGRPHGSTIRRLGLAKDPSRIPQTHPLVPDPPQDSIGYTQNSSPPRLLELQDPPRVLGLAEDLYFTTEPQRHLYFTNTSGAVVNCVAEGVPPPTVTWTLADDRPLDQVVGPLLKVLSNGSLIFSPFPAAHYDARVHAAVYTCRASNPAGTLLATPTLVRAVVVADFEVQVYDRLVMAGNTGVLHCVVPSYLREFVTVTSWLIGDHLHVYPSLHGDGKYHMTESGDLHVLRVAPADGRSRFRCRVLHKLTGASHLSQSPARIIVTEAEGGVAPQMGERGGRQVVAAGQQVTLPCIAQGHPPPSTLQVSPREIQVDAGGTVELVCHVSGSPVEEVRWVKDGRKVRSNGRVTVRPKEVLRVSSLQPSDAGLYQCSASHGSHYAHAHARVTLGASPPELQYQFIEQTLQPGPAVSLKCIATGSPTPHVTWTLDGFPLPHSHRLVKGQFVSASGEVISHVNISSVQVVDGGSYTCAAENSAGIAAHSARLNVYGPPQVRPMGQLTAVAGRTFTVSCPAAGHPISVIKWTKDGVQLPRSHRQRVLANGTLVLLQVTLGADDGRYACTASARTGRSDTQSLQLQVLVPPKLAPFSFAAMTREGLRAQVTCMVQEGDQPVRFAWTQNGRPLDARLGVRTSQLDAYTSILVVERASSAHSGNYTCTATNAADATSSTATLTVSVPPSWVVEPSGGSVALGGSLALPCLARGFPRPTTTWLTQTASGEFVRVGEGGKVGAGGLEQWSNGTLWVARASRSHEGRYLCEADNGVLPVVSKLVNLTVNEPPWFVESEQRQQVRVGAIATLTCHAHGDDPLTLTWTRDAAPLPPSPGELVYQVSVREGTAAEDSSGRGSSGKEGELLIQDARLSDSGTFTCTASNTHGTRTSRLHLLVQDVPAPPSAVRVGERGSRHLLVTWTPPEDSNAPITAYVITVKPLPAGSSGGREERVRGQEVRAVVGGLTPATRYTVSVAAVNSVGRGRGSPPLNDATHEEAPSAPPQNVKVGVTWDPPPPNTTHGTLLGYQLGLKPHSDGENGAYNFTSVGGVGGTGSSRVGGLRPHNRYVVVVRALNSKGPGPLSPPAHTATLQDKPSAPPGQVRCEALSSSALAVTWVPPSPDHRNGDLTTYRVAFWVAASPDAEGEGGSVATEGLRARLEGLLPFTNYSISVSAATRAGQGVASPALTCTTHQDVPEAPARVKAVVSGSRAAIVSWAPPARPHGRLTRYTVHWAAGSGGAALSRRVDPQLTHLALRDLPHAAHQVWVTAATQKGEGPPSPVVIVKPSHTVPAGVWAVGGNVTAAWREDISLACGAVGVPEPILSWTHQGKPIPSTNAHTNGGPVVQRDGTLTLGDLERKDGGRYTCTATNTHGSDTVIYHLTVLASSIKVQWTVEDEGGAAVLGATIHFRAAGETWKQASVGGETTAFTARDLRCGTLYHLYLTVHNRVEGQQQRRYYHLRLASVYSTQATLYLGQWGDGGCPITHFSQHYRPKPAGPWTTGKLREKRGFESRAQESEVGTGVWEGVPPAPPPAWEDPRVLVPALVSVGALLLTLATVCVCLRRRPTNRPPQKGDGAVAAGGAGEEKAAAAGRGEQLYTALRRPAPTPPMHDHRRPSGEYPGEELYHYAAATYQMDGSSPPPPPAPPSPPIHAHHRPPAQQTRPHKAFTALVYQPPSLHDVDSPNLNQLSATGTVVLQCSPLA